MRFIGCLILGLALGAGACGGQSAGDFGNRGDGAGRGTNTGGQPGSNGVGGSAGQDDDWSPADLLATYTVNDGAVTIEWGNADRTCDLPANLACGFGNASVTLDASQVVAGAEIDLSTTTGYMSVSGVNEGGSGPDDCWGGGGSLFGQLSIYNADFAAGTIGFSTSGVYSDPNLDGEYIAYACDAAEPKPEQPGPAAVFTWGEDTARLSWGNVARTCHDSSTVECGEAKGDVTLTKSALVVGKVIQLESTDALQTSSGVNTGGSGPDDCWWGGGTSLGELEILAVSQEQIQFRVSGTDFEDPNIDGVFTATSCN
ncbi:MAG: hypothetical protein AB7K71_11475 [Polyangiaceae bacterium]